MSSTPVQHALAGPFDIHMAYSVLFNPFVLFGLSLYFFGMLLWLVVLSKVEVSFAYPFVSLGFVFTAIGGRIFFNDEISFEKIVGTLLIMAGVVVLSRG